MPYYDMLLPVQSPTITPRLETILTLTLKSGEQIITSNYLLTDTELRIFSPDYTLTYTLADLKGTIHQGTILVYPKLPDSIPEPPKSDPMGWVMANIRGVITQSSRGAKSPIVISVDKNPEDSSLCLTMTNYWESIPAYVRHTWLQAVWLLYVTLIAKYNADTNYCRVVLHPYNDSNRIIGYRSPWRSSVDGSPDYLYDLNRGCPQWV
jgi:hypothetical protein